MCPVPKGKDQFNRPVYSLGESLDEFDNCDYIAGKFPSVANDLCIVQLNVRGIGSKSDQFAASNRQLCFRSNTRYCGVK